MRLVLYAPDLSGHPQVYVRVIADALAGQGVTLLPVLGFSERFPRGGCPDLVPLEGRPEVGIVDARSASASGSGLLRAEELRALQERLRADVTLFVDGDRSHPEFERIVAGAAPRLAGRNLAIFGWTGDWHPREHPATGAPVQAHGSWGARLSKRVRGVLFGAKHGRRAYFEDGLLGGGVLDEIWAKDERLTEWHGPPVYWMPEITRPARPTIPAPRTAADEQAAEQLRSFLSSQPGREPVLYFGTAAHYKGYDLFLELLLRDDSLCGVHAGLGWGPAERALFGSGLEELRERARATGRLLETGAYVSSLAQKDLYFGCVRIFATTHRLVLSSSTMLQAVEAGKPLLMPDRGLVAHRVRKHRLGRLYRYEDLDDLRRQLDRMRREPLERYAAAARAFWPRFSDEAVVRFVRERVRSQAPPSTSFDPGQPRRPAESETG